MITSMQNSKIQLVRSLMQKPRERKTSGQIVVEGVRLVEELMDLNQGIEFLLFTEKLSRRGFDLIKSAQERKIVVEEIHPNLMKKIAGTETSQGILAVAEKINIPLPANLDYVLICDSIRDPGNLGTIIRSAAAAGVQTVMLSEDSADAFSPKVLRSAMGAHFHISILETDWQEIRKVCKVRKHPLKVFLASAKSNLNCWQVDFKQPVAIIVGNEAQGAGTQAQHLADNIISIPMPGERESLNAAVAAGVILFEVVRQRSQ